MRELKFKCNRNVDAEYTIMTRPELTARDLEIYRARNKRGLWRITVGEVFNSIIIVYATLLRYIAIPDHKKYTFQCATNLEPP